MKLKHCSVFVVIVLGLLSCIRSEEPNAEADITACRIEEKDILNTEPIINNEEIDNYSVSFFVKKGADLTKITPHFELTPGATIEPESGVTQNFTEEINYIVTSEDRKWKKHYTVKVIQSELPTSYSFEQVTGKGKYDVFVEKHQGNIIMSWASGNPGFSITGVAESRLDYPTIQSEKGYKGNCAKLTTLSTGKFGGDVGMPIAAGNLFLGRFDLLSAIVNPLKATQFGLPFNMLPKTFSGYYKYKRGEDFYEKGELVKDRIDTGDIYAIFYETDDDTKTLDGSNSLTHPNLIARARIDKTIVSDKWIKFELPFTYDKNKTINAEKLKNGGYKLGIVFTSSIDGASFNGAIGSTLWIDEVEITYELNPEI